jgi:ubiquinone/menaquinone biosynthesis C-methylase UbiE
MKCREVQEKYDAFASSYDCALFPLERFGLRRLRRRLLAGARGKVLEVGVGTGRNLLHYPSGCVVTGVDLSRPMLARAVVTMEQRAAGERCLQMDTQALAFRDCTFDTVVDALCLCTYGDPVAALREMTRVCRPDGRILLLEHGRSTSGWLGWLQDKTAAAHARALGCVWNREPHELVREAGLRVYGARRTLFGVIHVLQTQPVSSPKP